MRTLFYSLFFSPYFTLPSSSALRKAQENLSDPKYSGKRVSRAQLLNDREESPPSDSQGEDSESDDESQAAKGSELDTPEPVTQQVPQPDVVQTINQTRQEDQKKGLAVSRQLVRLFYLFTIRAATTISHSYHPVAVGVTP